MKIKIGSLLGRKFSRRKKDTFSRKKMSQADRKAGKEWFRPHKRTCLSKTSRKPLSIFSSPELRSFWPAPRIVSSGGSRAQEGVMNLGLGTSAGIGERKSEVSGNLVPRVLSLPPSRKYPGFGWSRGTQNLGANKNMLQGRGSKV